MYSRGKGRKEGEREGGRRETFGTAEEGDLRSRVKKNCGGFVD